MNFNEKILELRKSKSLSQDELGEKLQVSRQTISKWETGQSYLDFQRLVLLSDYFGITLDALVKDIDVQDVRNKNLTDQQVSELYNNMKKEKVYIRIFIKCGIIWFFIGIILVIGFAYFNGGL